MAYSRIVLILCLVYRFLTTNGVNAAQESVATCNSINNNVNSDCPGFFKTEYWYYYGEDISGSYQNSYADCCRQCTQNDKCSAFSWSRLTKACFLKSGISSGGYSSEDNDSGRRLNIGTNTTGCSGFVKTENWVLYSEDIGATYQNSYADCCQQCSLNNKCNAFIWGRQSKACYLKSSVGDGGRAGADVDTGVRLTTVTETIDFSTFTKTENWVLYSEDIGATYQNSYANCNQQCSLNNKCNAFIWGRDSKACYLKSGVGDGGRAGAGVDAGRRLDIGKLPGVFNKPPRFETNVIYSVQSNMSDWYSTGYYVAGNNSIEIEVLKQECAEWSVQIGCHTDVLSDITNRQRPAVIFLRRSLQPKRLQLCSSYGGLLFLRSPDASGCSITVSLNNVVLTPTYNLADPYRVCAWEQKRKTADGLWADINSLYIAFNMPSSSVLSMTNTQLDIVLSFWDSVVLANHDLRGTVPIRRDRFVADIQPVVGGMHAGYPIVTTMDVVNPSNRAFMLNIDYLKDKTIEPIPGLRWAMFHELGHNMQRDWWTFNGTREVTNNIFVLHALETICQVRPGFYAWADQQMSKAREYIKNGANFVKWREDPLLGLLIYTQLAQQFGWSNYKAVFRYYENNKPDLTNDQQKIDYWIVTFSQQVKKNLIPLFKFWGFPISASTVKTLSTLPTAVISDEIIQIDPRRYTL